MLPAEFLAHGLDVGMLLLLWAAAQIVVLLLDVLFGVFGSER